MPTRAMASATPPANDGTRRTSTPSGSRMYMYTITRR